MQLTFNNYIISTATTYVRVKLAFLNFAMEAPARGWDVMGHSTPAPSAAHPISGQRVSSHSSCSSELLQVRLLVSNDIHVSGL